MLAEFALNSALAAHARVDRLTTALGVIAAYGDPLARAAVRSLARETAGEAALVSGLAEWTSARGGSGAVLIGTLYTHIFFLSPATSPSLNMCMSKCKNRRRGGPRARC
jgi:hypothetical protein